jgi:hypothetical protein
MSRNDHREFGNKERDSGMGVIRDSGSMDPLAGLPKSDVAGGRKAWQDFKKAHPDFAKNKSLNLDLGPTIDQYDKARTQYERAMINCDKERSASDKRIDAQMTHVIAAMNAYRVIVQESNNSAMKRDFDKLLTQEHPSLWGRRWQAFKKAYPEFEKTKTFKANLGPYLEKVAKEFDGQKKINEQVNILRGRAESDLKRITAAINAYSIFVDKAKDPAMERDFNKVTHALLGK